MGGVCYNYPIPVVEGSPMTYWQAKRDLEFAVGYRKAIIDYWEAQEFLEMYSRDGDRIRYTLSDEDQNKYRVLVQSKETEYPTLREKIAKGFKRASAISFKHDVTFSAVQYPPPMIAGSAPPIPINFYQAVLTELGYQPIDHSLTLDALSEMIGACEEEVNRQWKHLRNPFYWIIALLKTIIRLPFIILQLSGFDVAKVEDKLFAKILKLIEVAAIGYILIRYGSTNPHLRDFLMKILPK
jgi:hypothetical protein